MAADLAFVSGVVALFAECWCELDGGDEEGAGLADRFEVAVEFDGSGAVAVAEHAPVHLGSKFAHFCAFVAGGELAGLVVERFDFGGHGEVFVCDGAVSDFGVDHGHGQRFVAEERCYCFEAHAAVDGLGGEGVAELVGVDVADPGGVRGSLNGSVEAFGWDWSTAVAEQQVAAQACGALGEPVVEEFFQVGV